MSIITTGGTGYAETEQLDNWAAEYAKRAVSEHRDAAVIDHPDGSVTTDKIAAGAVTGDRLAAAAVGTGNIADKSVTGAKIADYTVRTINIEKGAINNVRISNGAVDARCLAAGAVTADKLADESITDEKIADGAVTYNKIANAVIGAEHIVNGEIMSNKIADGAVVSNKLANGSVVSNKIADGAVTTDKLADESVTLYKIADNAIDEYKIDPEAVCGRHIRPGAVTADKLAEGVAEAIAAGAVDDGAVSAVTAYSSQKTQSLIDVLALAAGSASADNWAAVRGLVAAGLGPAAFPVGTQLTTEHTDHGTIIWDVADHQDVVDADGVTRPGMQLLMHHTTDRTFRFDAPEALMYFEDGLAAGTYNFSVPVSYDTAYNDLKTDADTETVPIQFTLTQAIPAGGQLRLVWERNTKLSTAAIATYASGAATEATESGVTVTRGTGGTSLGDAKANVINGNINAIERARSGSGNYKESAVRQYLNADGAAGAYWTQQTIFDRISEYVTASAGFAAGFSDDFLAAVCPVRIKTCTNNYTEVNDTVKSYYTTTDKFYLPSYTEIAGAKQNNIAEGERFAMTADYAQADFIKCNKAGTAQSWWQRSPNTSNTHYVRNCYLSGATGYNGSAGWSLPVAAACTIA